MRIVAPRIEERGDRVSYRVDVESGCGVPELWFSVDREHGGLVSDRAEAALLALLLPAMRRGERIEVEGPMSARFLYNLRGPLQTVLASVIEGLRTVPLDAERLQPPPPRAPGVTTGFSAGIDSFSVLADHHFGDPPPGYRITHLVYNNVGSHGPPGNDVFRARYERLRPVTVRLGLPYVDVDSNLAAFYEDLGFKHSYTLRNAAVALLLQAGIGRSLHASGTALTTTHAGPAKDIAFCDPIILPMASTEAVDLVPVGGEYSRVEKTLKVAEIADSWASLDVCVRNDRPGNCSTCKKCVRTMMTLEMAGLLDRYAGVFDRQAFRKGGLWQVARTLHGGKQNSRDIRAFARERGYRFPMRARLIARTRLDTVRDWILGRIGRTGAGGRWIRGRKVERSPLRVSRR